MVYMCCRRKDVGVWEKKGKASLIVRVPPHRQSPGKKKGLGKVVNRFAIEKRGKRGSFTCSGEMGGELGGGSGVGKANNQTSWQRRLLPGYKSTQEGKGKGIKDPIGPLGGSFS